MKIVNLLLCLLLIFYYPLMAKEKSKNSKGGKAKAQPASSAHSFKPSNIERVYGKTDVFTTTKKALLSPSKLKAEAIIFAKDIDVSQFKKIPLIDVVLEAVANSFKIKSAREQYRAAKLKLKEAYAAYYPTMDAEYKRARNRKRSETKKYFNDESYKYTIRQNLFAGFATHYKIKSLKETLKTTKNRYEQVIISEMENAIKAYFDVLFSLKAYNANKRNFEKLKKILGIVTLKFKNGDASLGDMSNIKANTANAEAKLTNVKSKLSESLEFYRFIVGDKLKDTIPCQDKFDIEIDEYESVLQRALKRNYDILNHKLNIKAEELKLLNVKADFRPKIDLELSYEKTLDQENFKNTESLYKAQITFRYNIFNAGKDEVKYLKVYSKIRELRFRLQAEIRKLKWNLSKLYVSIKSLKKIIQSSEGEVLAARDTVDSFWESFKNGEQDLQTLLQAQRQLNRAELELVANKKKLLVNYFKLLTITADILDFFHLDIDKENFIDFSYTYFGKSEEKLKLPESLVKVKAVEGNITETNETNITYTPEETNETAETNITEENMTKEMITEANETVEEEELITNIEKLKIFEKKFLDANNSSFTVVIEAFGSIGDCLDYLEKKDIVDRAFIYEALKGNKTVVKIAYGIYAKKEEADFAKKALQKSLKDKIVKLRRVKEVKKEYKRFLKNCETPLKEKLPFKTDKKFMRMFLNAPKDYYTINIGSFLNKEQAGKFVKTNKIKKQSFVFGYGEKEAKLYKVVYGVFEDYERAQEALNSLGKIKDEYYPIIERIELKQNLYYQYNKGKKSISSESKKVKPKITAEIKEINKTKETNLTKTNTAPLSLEENLTQKSKAFKKEEINITQEIKKTNEEIKKAIKEAVKEKNKNITETNVSASKAEINASSKAKQNILKQKNPKTKTSSITIKKALEENLSKEKTKLPENKKIQPPMPKYTEGSILNEFKKASNDSFTIFVGSTKKKGLKKYYQRFLIKNYPYVIIEKENKYNVFVGVFKSKKDALKTRETLHPILYKKSKIIKIGKVK